LAIFDTKWPPSTLASEIPAEAGAGWAFSAKSTAMKLFPGWGV
jgi:hypothetical protein